MSTPADPSFPPATMRLTVRTSPTKAFDFVVPRHWQVVDERDCPTADYVVVVSNYGWDPVATPPDCPPRPAPLILFRIAWHPPTVTMLACGGDVVPLDVPRIGATTVRVTVNKNIDRTCITPKSGWPADLHFIADSAEGTLAVLDVLRTLEPAR